MSRLSAVLRGRRRAGLHVWDDDHGPGHVEQLAARVRDAGWDFAHVAAGDLDDVQALLDALAPALGLPEHYGRNLDALHDLLAERENPTVLLAVDWGRPAAADLRRWAGLAAVLGEREQGERPLEVLFAGDLPPLP